MIADDLRNELAQLMTAEFEAVVTPAAHNRLQQLLDTSPAARQFYVEHADLHASLLWEQRGFRDISLERNCERLELVVPKWSWMREVLGKQAMADDQGSSTASEDSLADARCKSGAARPLVLGFLKRTSAWVIDRSPLPTLFVAVVVYGLFGFVVWQMSQYRSGNYGKNERDVVANSQSIVLPVEAPVATFVHGEDCVWADNSTKPDDGQPLKPETLRLVSGLAELSFNDGAQVIVEGPATFGLQSTSRGLLEQGKLVARVPKRAVGFTVETPTSTIIDLGTEFGVQVSENGGAEITVFDGRVRTHVTGTANNSDILLGANQSAQIMGGKLTLTTFDSGRYRELRRNSPKTAINDERVLLFSDNFNVHGNPFILSPNKQDEPTRQQGLLRRLNYTTSLPEGSDVIQLNSARFPGALLMGAYEDYVTVSPNVNFTAERRAGVRYTVEFDVDPSNDAASITPVGSDVRAWAGAVFGAVRQLPSIAKTGGVSLQLREGGRFQLWDSTEGGEGLAVSGNLATFGLKSSGWHRVVARYDVPAFGGNNVCEFEIEIDGKIVASFKTHGGLLGNYVVLHAYGGADYVVHGFDNLRVFSEPLRQSNSTSGAPRSDGGSLH